MFKEHPILGVGVGNFQLHFPKYGLDKFVDPLIINGQNTLQSPHNDFIGLLCETGILGLLAYSIIYLTILFQLRSLIKNAETTNQKWKFIYILGAVIGYLIISLFDFPMERIEHQILLMLLFSITVTSYYKSCKPDTTANNKNYIIIIFLTLSVLYSALISAFRINGEIQTAKMKAANENKRWPQTILYANRATSYFYQLDATGIPVDWYKGIAYFHKKELTQSETYLQNAYRQAPYQLQVINSLASCYETNGQRQKAIALYSKALKISPRFEESRLNLAAIYYNSANFQKAFQTIDKIDFHSTNRRYHAFLLPILSKEINRILSSKADRQTAKKFATNINTPQKLLTLYFDSKRNNTTFEQYILKP